MATSASVSEKLSACGPPSHGPGPSASSLPTPGLPPFQSTSAAVSATLPQGWQTPKKSRLLDANRPAHPSIGSFTKHNSIIAAYWELYDTADLADGKDVPTRSGGNMVTGGGALHVQWDLDDDSERYFYVVKSDHHLYRVHADTADATDLLDAAKLNAALGSQAKDEDVYFGPSEGLSVGKARNQGHALAFGYFVTGSQATFFAYDVTSDTVLPQTQTEPLLAGQPYDFVSVSLDSGYGIAKPRPQSDPSSVPWWFFPLDPTSGVGPKVTSKVAGIELDTVSHATACYRMEGNALVDAWCSLIEDHLNVFRLDDGERITDKPIEGQWAKHIGYVDNTPFVVADDAEGNLTAERTDGGGGHPLGTGWNGPDGYSHLSRWAVGENMRVIGQRANGDVEVWWW